MLVQTTVGPGVTPGPTFLGLRQEVPPFGEWPDDRRLEYGPGPSGSIVVAPPLARNVAICCCAATANGPDAPEMLLRNVCGFLTV